MAKKRKPQPLAPPPQCSTLRSRKRARQVTTLFHKYSQKKDEALARARARGCEIESSSNEHEVAPTSTSQNALLEEVRKWDDKLAEIGGREEYQRASQMNTSLFSTSKWVLGVLGKWGWLDGQPIDDDQNQPSKKRKNGPRRDTRLLEIGAINTQLLDAAERTRQKFKHGDTASNQSSTFERVHRLEVHAIDIRSTDERIQQIDFFQYPLPDTTTDSNSPSKRPQYDVLVNSMVLNCVTTPDHRGKMLQLCYQQLRPGGVLFLTLPKLCLKQSKHISCKYFEEILTDGVGFEILDESAKDSPKLAFYVLKRPMIESSKWRDDFGCIKVMNSGKNFRNSFGVILSKDDNV
ncbi:hypothetical protein ACHAWO_011897 [Cyclotella atomus]|uniref:25S rRNA adenine-N(1) methyltransferase n=1 Tax=Cyclotella atomus TaxID=382360 RepID=A0ABD3NW87_9STRA